MNGRPRRNNNNNSSSASPSTTSSPRSSDPNSPQPVLKVAEVLVRKTIGDQQHFLEIRVVLLGGADAGKSTFIGVMTHSELDNGRGKSRLNALRHRHEVESGRTSSISHRK